MSTKKKFWLSIACLSMVVLVSAVSVGVTIAVLQAKVTSSFSVTYTAKNVDATVHMYSQFINSSKQYTATSQELVFNPEEETSKNFDNTEIELNSFKLSVYENIKSSSLSLYSNITADLLQQQCDATAIFAYQIYNHFEQPMPVSLKLNGTVSKNLKVSYLAKRFYELTPSLMFAVYGLTSNPLFISSLFASQFSSVIPTGITCPYDEGKQPSEDPDCLWVFIKISVVDTTQDVETFQGSIDFTLG